MVILRSNAVMDISLVLSLHKYILKLSTNQLAAEPIHINRTKVYVQRNKVTKMFFLCGPFVKEPQDPTIIGALT